MIFSPRSCQSDGNKTEPSLACHHPAAPPGELGAHITHHTQHKTGWLTAAHRKVGADETELDVVRSRPRYVEEKKFGL